MAIPDLVRAVAATTVGLVSGGLSLALEAPMAAALMTTLIACVGAWYATAGSPSTMAPMPPSAPPVAAPDIGDVMEAISDPLLLVERHIVVRANAPARALLGPHIVGEDVRLAIRHPAAADRLARGSGNDPEPVVLSGLGERERRWDMSVRELPGGARLVQLRESTSAYVAERMRVDFVANASHELRTPLSTLLGFIETLQDQNAAEDAATRSRFLDIMLGEARRMRRLVDDLISLSRIEADKFQVPQTALDLAPLIDEVCGTIRAGMREQDRPIIVRAAADAPAIAGDRVQLSQLLHNLIGNALKYGRAGTAIHVALQNARGGMARLSVTDEGDGIAEEHIPRLTERFYRVDPGRSRALGGTGLGLAIVKHIVERHRGRLSIASEVGRGTTVSVLLPAAEPLSSNCNETVTQIASIEPSQQ